MDIYDFNNMNQIAIWCVEWLEEQGCTVQELRIAHTGPARYIIADDIRLIVFPFADDILCFYAKMGDSFLKAGWDITVQWLNGTIMGSEKLVKALLESWCLPMIVRAAAEEANNA